MYINETFKTKKPRESSLLDSKNKPTLSNGEKILDKLSTSNKDSHRTSQERIQKFLKEQRNNHEKRISADTSGDQHPPASVKESEIELPSYTTNHEKDISSVENSYSTLVDSSSLSSNQARTVMKHAECFSHSFATKDDNNNSGWIKYDKSILPDHFSFLLDVLQGLESAWILLRSRRQLVLFSRVQPIVQKTLKRRLYYEHVCQIANLCPELLKLCKWKESSDDVELIFCDVSQTILQDKATNPKTAIAARRIFLHRKLVECYEQGILQLDKSDPCKGHIDDQDNKSDHPVSTKRSIENLQDDESLWRKTLKTDDSLYDKPTTQSTLKDSSISEKLLKKVRERERRETQQIAIKEKQREQIVLSRLPKLADAIRSIFISSKKTVLPFDLLLKQLKDQEMIPLSRDEISEQIYEIVKKIPEWLQLEENKSIKIVKLNSRTNYFSLRKQLTVTSIP
ncbi:hypothetical protein GpartN1_g5814.t1 [Galdieria partita]|uniref:TFIIE beta domain-containing protein n=1 Tax=Galdieria partita TaxID=83374 RepID=A0A9C7Q003_9RHOD|nr:hypothetical protein GpartN1_g5814.t1 [Galdieria partita]